MPLAISIEAGPTSASHSQFLVFTAHAQVPAQTISHICEVFFMKTRDTRDHTRKKPFHDNAKLQQPASLSWNKMAYGIMDTHPLQCASLIGATFHLLETGGGGCIDRLNQSQGLKTLCHRGEKQKADGDLQEAIAVINTRFDAMPDNAKYQIDCLRIPGYISILWYNMREYVNGLVKAADRYREAVILFPTFCARRLSYFSMSELLHCFNCLESRGRYYEVLTTKWTGRTRKGQEK
ncbi:hypothetical protein P170DRAFT_495176 [Aspergillus steynii IBT 23096]|uniref:Uncharacterized protein n=1 Tax=Aspergillus steynii IBT 23096 TaxID=1392250 RepID=A0A2I2G8X0_9EURO|nr:uncharacterized protein P170DRAFT_495176 [Aspergillus steynii IBT 23096]PLB49332.1 hypothetical protein P170DRAFT_495176 [Aspergillus steynii IBT 23096]